jgi:hypothetical protein
MSENAAVVQAVPERGPPRRSIARPGADDVLRPTQIEKRRNEWGPGVVESKLDAARVPFTERVGDRVTIQHG